jgi:hypothetical protein
LLPFDEQGGSPVDQPDSKQDNQDAARQGECPGRSPSATTSITEAVSGATVLMTTITGASNRPSCMARWLTTKPAHPLGSIA